MIPPAEQIEAPAELIENGAASEIIASVEEEESKRRGLLMLNQVGGLARARRRPASRLQVGSHEAIEGTARRSLAAELPGWGRIAWQVTQS